MIYGDVRAGYQIVDHIVSRVLRDRTNKPFVGFYTTKRVGGGVERTLKLSRFEGKHKPKISR